MDILLFSALALLLLSVLALFVRLGRLTRANAGLQAELTALTGKLVEQDDELAALYAAGVNMDRVLLEHDRGLRECLERIESLRAEDNANQPYHAAIEKLRKGGDAQTLINELGLNPSEASLLARLHGAARER